MKYKPDWEETQKRYLAWWKGEVMERCAIAVYAPKAEAYKAVPPARPATPFERWTDLDYAAANCEFNMSTSFYGGEAFPRWTVGYPGHASIPTFLGCPIDLNFDTGWWDPILNGESLEDVFGLKIDHDEFWWKFAIKALNRAVTESEGCCVPCIGAFGGSGDTLAALRSTEQLLFDVIDRPEEVAAAEKYLMDMWFEVYDTFYNIITETAQGSTCWFDLWAPGKFYAAQNDFAYMISPEMYNKVFLPVIEEQIEFLDYTVYHVDGEGNFAHVPALCELPKLQAIQILPGAGKPSPLNYMDTLKYVQKAGKNLHISIPFTEVETALSELSSTGLFIQTWCPSEEQAKELLANTLKWSHQ